MDTRVPTDANQNDVDWEAHSLGSQHRVSSLFSQSAQHRPAGGLTANATEPLRSVTERIAAKSSYLPGSTSTNFTRSPTSTFKARLTLAGMVIRPWTRWLL